jgi:hypothetical protein
VGALRGNLPGAADLLPAHLVRGDPACYQSHLLHAEPDGSFSIALMVWRPGQETVIHDNVAWCVTAVLQGREYEEIFALADGGHALVFAARNANPAGSVSGFARLATSTASAIPAMVSPSRCTCTAPTSPAWAAASAATTASRAPVNPLVPAHGPVSGAR